MDPFWKQHLDNYEHPEAIALFVVFSMIMMVVMLNLVIAIMSEAMSNVKKKAELEVSKLQGEAIVEVPTTVSVPCV